MVRILLPLEILEGETVTQAVAELLAPAEIVVVGYHAIPEQTAPGQARMSFEDRAQELLAQTVEIVETAGASDVSSTLVFTPAVDDSIQRIASEEDCDAICYLNPVAAVESMFVPLFGDVDARRIGRFTGAFLGERNIPVTLLEIVEPGQQPTLTDEAKKGFAETGFDESRIHERTIESDAPIKSIGEVAEEFDATVIGEKTPTLSELVFGEYEERITKTALGPVFVVRSAIHSS